MDVAKDIFAGGDVPKDRFSEIATDKYKIPIFANAEKDNGLHGYTDVARVSVPCVTIAARGTIGFTVKRMEPFLPVVRLITVIPNKEKITLDYLYYALRNCRPKYRGTSIPQLTVPDIKKYSFEIVEVPKQEKITRILDKIEQLIEMKKRQIECYNNLIKARFVEMFGMIGTDIYGWGLTSLGEVCDINPQKSQDNRLVSDLIVSFVSMSAVSEKGEIDTSETKRYDDVKSGFTYFLEEDVLFAKITPCMENGKGAVAKKLCNGIGFGSTEFHVLRPIAGKSNPYWIYVLTTFQKFRTDAANNMTGSAGQRRVPSSFLKNYKVAIPPLELQEQFAAFVRQTDKSKVAIQKALDETQILFDSLMQKYFG